MNYDNEMELVPAALYYQNHGGFGVYIKWVGNGTTDEVKVISAGPWNMHLSTPDRELYIVGNLNKAHGDVSMFGWDEFIPFSFFHEASSHSKGVGPSSYMVNAHQHTSAASAHNTRHAGQAHATRRTIYGDSGGYQLLQKKNFTDPTSVATFYNTNVDKGMVLDFPLLDSYNTDNVMRSAEMQRLNTEVMLGALDKRVQLVNISHGARLPDRRRFMQHVHRDEINLMAIPRAYYGQGITAFINSLTSFIHAMQEDYGDHYKQLHILGLAENRLFIPVMRMQALGLFGNIKITMDASTHLHMASSKIYFHHNHAFNNYSMLRIGNDNNLMNPMQRLPCSCPVCSALGWQAAFNVLAGSSSVTFPLMYHNIFAMDAYFKSMRWLTQNLEDKDMNTLIRKKFGHNKNVMTELQHAMGFIDTVRQKSLKVAQKKYSYYVDSYAESDDQVRGIGTSLFDSAVMLSEEEMADLKAGGWNEEVYEKEHSLIDSERLDLYATRISALQFAKSVKADRFKDPTRKTIKKKGKKGVKRIDRGKDFNVPEDKVKKIANTTARSGPSLSKMKQRKNSADYSRSKKGEVDGKKVVRTKRTKRL